MHGLARSVALSGRGRAPSASPLICFSHLQWDFVTQRPQHLMRRFARERHVLFWEEAAPTGDTEASLEVRPSGDGVTVLRPRLPATLTGELAQAALKRLLEEQLADVEGAPLLWFYTPMMVGIARDVRASAVVYDCMDELSAFRFADPGLRKGEAELLRRADVVFTGGYSLYEAKRDLHPNVHPFPSAVDVEHFAQARLDAGQPSDQRSIAGPRLGFYGVIDERIDLGLIDAVAAARPDWSLVMIGPTAKINPDDLPQRPNIHWLGQRDYGDLPRYPSGWDAALMPFAQNEATRFISPTKTPEYLAGGCPVVSTPITDVVRHFGALEGVTIAREPGDFIAACERELTLRHNGAWRAEADRQIAEQSWDMTVATMAAEIERVEKNRSPSPGAKVAPDRGRKGIVAGASYAAIQHVDEGDARPRQKRLGRQEGIGTHRHAVSVSAREGRYADPGK